MSAFLELTKPKNRSIEDNNYYLHKVKPESTEQFEETGQGERDCAAMVLIEWEPPMGPRYQWGFMKVEVEVVKSELQGPLDIGDLVVKGGGKGAKKGGEVVGGRREVRARSPVGALPSPLEELEEEPEPEPEPEPETEEESSEESEEE